MGAGANQQMPAMRPMALPPNPGQGTGGGSDRGVNAFSNPMAWSPGTQNPSTGGQSALQSAMTAQVPGGPGMTGLGMGPNASRRAATFNLAWGCLLV